MEEDEEVMSEVHIGCSPHLSSCLSSFTIALSGRPEINRASTIQPSEAGNESLLHEQIGDFIGKHVSVDENGDLDIPRRSSRCRHNARSIIDLVLFSEETHRQTISIYHRLKTTIPCVGLQIWKASLILGDFILHKMQTTSELKDAVILELGAGTGILGILLSAKARLVFLTDFNKDVLGNCFRNVLLNSRKSEASMETLRIRRLDWQEPWPPIATQIDAETSTDDHSLLVCLLSMVNLAYRAYVNEPAKSLDSARVHERAWDTKECEKGVCKARGKVFFSLQCPARLSPTLHLTCWLSASTCCYLGWGWPPGRLL